MLMLVSPHPVAIALRAPSRPSFILGSRLKHPASQVKCTYHKACFSSVDTAFDLGFETIFNALLGNQIDNVAKLQGWPAAHQQGNEHRLGF